MMTLEEAITHCQEKSCGNSECALEHKQLAEWLREFQILANSAKTCKIEQKSSWSKKDEEMLQGVINDIAIAQEQVYCKSLCEEEINWLKSLKGRHTWKPSDRELGAILTAIGDERQKGSDVAKELLNIYQQLKKLREE